MFLHYKRIKKFLNLIIMQAFCFHYYPSSDSFIFFLILSFLLCWANWFIFSDQLICSKKQYIHIIHVQINQTKKFLNSVSFHKHANIQQVQILMNFPSMFGIHHSRTVGSNIHVAMYLNHLLVSVLYLKQSKQDNDYI